MCRLMDVEERDPLVSYGERNIVDRGAALGFDFNDRPCGDEDMFFI